MDPIKLLGMVLGPDALAVFSEIKTALPQWLEDFERMKRQLDRMETDIHILRSALISISAPSPLPPPHINGVEKHE